MTTLIETDRLRLRTWTLDDVPTAHEIYRDPRVTRFLDGRPDASLDATRRRLQRRIDHQQQHGYSTWAIDDKNSGQLLGACGLFHLDGGPEVEIGYHLAHAAWGRGIATEAARPCIHYGFHTLELHRIVGVTDPDNFASRRVLEKCGLVYLGMRYCYRAVTTSYVITRTDAKALGII